MLKLAFRKLDIEAVNAIANWRYSNPEDGLYMKPYHDSYVEDPNTLKGPGGCDGYGVYFEDHLFGLFEYRFVKDGLEIGCALEPTFKGKGHGTAFVLAGVNFGVTEYQYTGSRVVLDVLVSNLAARKAYERAGFEVERSGEKTLRMVKEV